MDRNQKERLLFLKRQQKQQDYEKCITHEKEYLMSGHINFSQKYKFADEINTQKISEFLKNLPAITPVRPDFSKLLIEHPLKDFDQFSQFENERIAICCLCGSRELTKLYSYGTMDSFVNDFEHWFSISDYLLLIFDNFNDFIFIDDGKNIIKAKIF